VAAKQDAKVEELSSSLMEQRQKVDQLRNENQQLSIEREVWKSSESRAVRESQEFSKERNSANERLNELQRNFVDQGHVHESQMAKVDQRIKEMSRELQTSRKQLADLMDDHRTLTSRREAELNEFKIKSERFIAASEKDKADLLAATSREEASKTRITELAKRVAESEEKLLGYRGRDLNIQLLSSTQDPAKNIEIALSQAK
jgi:phage shock protein A